MPKGWKFMLLVSVLGVMSAASALLPSTTQKPPSAHIEEKKDDIPLSLKKEILKKTSSMKLKPYKKKFSFDLDESTLSAPTRSNKQKARIHPEEIEVKSKDGVTIRKPWDLTNHWDPRKDDQGRPWSRDMDTIAGAAVRAAVPEKPEPFFGLGITKSIDTQKKRDKE